MKRLAFILFAWAGLNSSMAQTQVIDLTTGNYSPPGIEDPTWKVKSPKPYPTAPEPVFEPAYVSNGKLYRDPYVGGPINGDIYDPYPHPSCGKYISNPKGVSHTNPQHESYSYLTYTSKNMHIFRRTFSVPTCAVSSAVIQFSTLIADNFISEIIINGISRPEYVTDTDLYSWNKPIQGLTMTLLPQDLKLGENTIDVVVYSAQEWMTLLVCGKITFVSTGTNFKPSITGNSTYNFGERMIFTASVGPGGETQTFWEISECDAYGNFISTGFNHNTGWLTGASNTYDIPFGATNKPQCGKYYKVRVAKKYACGTTETTKIVYIKSVQPAIAGNTNFCNGVPLTFTGSEATGAAANSFWEIAESDQYGNFIGGYRWMTWVAGAPGTFTFPENPPCGKYYKIKLAVFDLCQNWVEANKVIYRPCDPVITITQQPTACGTSGTVLTAGGANTYEWDYNGPTSQFGQTITTNPGSYCIPSLTSIIGGANVAEEVYGCYYRVTGTNAYGCTSSSGNIWIATPSPTLNPIINGGVFCPEINSIDLTITQYSSGNIQWEKKPCGGTFTEIAGADKLTYTVIKPTNVADYGTTYRAKITCNGNIKYTNETMLGGYLSRCFGGFFMTCTPSEPAMPTSSNSIDPDSFTFNVYPNPNNGAFTIQSGKAGVYSIVNSLGQTIQSVQLNEANNFKMEIENLDNGIYFIIGSNKNEVIRHKVVVTK